jgi:hypothetical protein
MGRNLIPYVTIFVLAFFVLPFWVGQETVKECTAVGNNVYSCSAAAVVRGQIKISETVSILFFWKTKTP